VYVAGEADAVSVLDVASLGFSVGGKSFVFASKWDDDEVLGLQVGLELLFGAEWSRSHPEWSFFRVVFPYFPHRVDGAGVVVQIIP